MAYTPVTCISVIDEAQNAASNATYNQDWASFRSAYPTRRFYLLDPGGGSFGHIPPDFASDPIAFGPIAVNRDNNNVANRSDWFTICALNGLPSGTVVSLAVDTSGSMTLSTVRASYDWFIEKCNNAGFILVVDTTFPNERWITPHNKSLPPGVNISVNPTEILTGQSSTLSWGSSGDINNLNISNIGAVSLTGSINVSPSTTTTYTITASGPGGTNSASTTLTVYPRVNISSFSASPNPQTSGSNGIPNYDTTLSWNTANSTSVSINQGIGSVSLNGSRTVTNLPQSTVGSNSPATRTYTLTATGFLGNTQTRTLTVEVYNDNTPRNFSVPNQNNVEPNSLIEIFVGQIQDIDMITAVTGGPGVQVSTNSTSWASTIFIANGNSLYVRATSLGFNTDPNGLANSTTFYVDVGPLRRFFTITTRAPIVQEIFNIANYNNKVPFPDIDTIESGPEHPAQQFIETATLTIDDVELSNPNGVEIKTNNPNVQVRKRRLGQTSFTSWKDLRSI
jgi:hypothetical protein